MYNVKAELYSILSALGYYCVQGSQAEFLEDKGQIPAITFRIDNNSVTPTLDREAGRQDITAAVDIWADDSTTATRVHSEVEAALRANDYRMTYSADVPAPKGALFHITCRFETLR